jgi:hypothetical protein
MKELEARYSGEWVLSVDPKHIGTIGKPSEGVGVP